MVNSILDRYGIKEVADFTFYDIGNDGRPTVPVLYLDTLKVSTVEQTGEESEAKGGKGNASLIIWDFGKEITVTLEDALFSAKSMAIMFGNGRVKTIGGEKPYIMKTEIFTATKAGKVPTVSGEDETVAASDLGWSNEFEAPDGKKYKKINPKFYDENGKSVSTLELGKKYFCSYDLKVSGGVIEVSANSFPGTYYCTGDTFARSETTGKDELIWNSSLVA